MMRGRRADRVRSTKDAAEIATICAENAARAGTFGVGGLLLGPNGEVLKIASNQVLINGGLDDPTAHVERQLIDWYFVFAKPRDLPPPNECIIVSSLDPCMQCAGAILATGFRAVHVCDDPTAGVHSRPGFGCLPRALRDRAAATFSRMPVNGLPKTLEDRPPWWPNAWTPIDAALHARAKSAMFESLEAIQNTIASGSGSNGALARSPDGELVTPTQTIELGLPAERSLEAALCCLENAKKIAERETGTPDAAVLYSEACGGVAVAIGQSHLSPIRIGLLELVRKYSRQRAAGHFDGSRLPHPRDALLITSLGPGTDALGVMMVGAYGSTMEGPLSEPRNERWWYLAAEQDSEAVLGMVADFPPLYTTVIGVHPVPVPAEYVKACLAPRETKSPYSV